MEDFHRVLRKKLKTLKSRFKKTLNKRTIETTAITRVLTAVFSLIHDLPPLTIPL